MCMSGSQETTWTSETEGRARGRGGNGGDGEKNDERERERASEQVVVSISDLSSNCARAELVRCSLAPRLCSFRNPPPLFFFLLLLLQLSLVLPGWVGLPALPLLWVHLVNSLVLLLVVEALFFWLLEMDFRLLSRRLIRLSSVSGCSLCLELGPQSQLFSSVHNPSDPLCRNIRYHFFSPAERFLLL